MIFKVDDLTKNYGEKRVFVNSSFEAQTGEIIGLLGKNGAGKTTFFNCVAGLTECEATNLKEVYSIPFAYMSKQNFNFFNDTVTDLCALLPVIYDGFDLDYFKKKVAALGIDSSARINSLSTGQRAAVDFIVAMAQKATVYLLDEPFANLDAHFREFMKTELLSLVTPEKLFIVSSHDISELERVFSSVIILNEGKFGKATPCDDIRAAGESLSEYFLRETK